MTPLLPTLKAVGHKNETGRQAMPPELKIASVIALWEWLEEYSRMFVLDLDK
ncbi:Uncharacterized protein YR821_2972 [Yersinia ruckeri]|uniref:Transposase n=1 Tax=Yersinia ruckeri TaxID=29486 RepID=A0A0A8VMJ1_YERRU|nr:hypothetical protein yruck0001_3570 [Yersinia ruckeri ATCC 29473]QTD77888.1 Uncharacterized protein YR821_2972 [Yersinia ruckeri]CEK28811.1 hypothetical protein CSF007_15440 [Yersinia ruckeri]